MRDILRAGLRVLGLCAVVTLASCGGSGGGGGVALPILPPTSPPPTSPPVTGELEIRTLSNRADMLSDGDAYVEIVLPEGAERARPGGGPRRQGPWRGLRAARQRPRARHRDRAARGPQPAHRHLKTAKKGAKLAITNFGRGGNIFAGVPMQPWVCATKAPSAALVNARHRPVGHGHHAGQRPRRRSGRRRLQRAHRSPTTTSPRPRRAPTAATRRSAPYPASSNTTRRSGPPMPRSPISPTTAATR